MHRHSALITMLLGLSVLLFAAAPARPQPRPGQAKGTQLDKSRRPGKPDRPDRPDRADKPDPNDDEGFSFHLGDHKADPGKPLQPIQAPPFGDRLNLAGAWLIHGGNNPAYASPTLDDHDWAQVDSSHSLWQQLDTAQPLPETGFLYLNEVWYRRHIRLSPGSHDLALTVADFGGSYRVFANGHELGGHGRMAGSGDYMTVRSATYPIPDALLLPGSPGVPNPPGVQTPAEPELVLAIHAFVGTMDRVTFKLGDGLNQGSTVYLGTANLLYRDQQTYFANGLTESAGILTLWAVLCVLAIALTFLIPKVAPYPLLAVYAGGHLLGLLLIDYAEFHYFPQTHWLYWPVNLALIASQLAALEFCRSIAGIRRNRWFVAFEVLYILCYAALIPAALGVLSYAVCGVLNRTGYYLLFAVIALLIAMGVRRRKQDAYVLASCAGLYLFYLAVWGSLHYVDFDYSFLTRLASGFIAHLRPGPLGDLAIVIAFLDVILIRTLRLVRERATIATEIEAARTMQQLLLARSSEPTPGFLVETAYLPAGEVGGDFFLILPIPAKDGVESGLFVIVGDVSGKGLRAAMRVSMILGVLRREPSRQPEVVLCSLNEALLSQSDGGFTTACCVRLSSSGQYTVSNAGHIAPYFVGDSRSHELDTPPALPLGLAPEQTYGLVEGRLAPGQRLVLMSDGVPEARTHKGELYGFERLPSLTLLPAAAIADTAQRFGQEDDITVLTVTALTPTTSRPPPPGGVVATRLQAAPPPRAVPPPPRP